MDILFENIIERDIDLLIMRHFSLANQNVINLFAKKAGIIINEGFVIDSVAHSVTTSDGETDIEIIIWDNNEKIAFIIENKINAVAQPNQARRYEIRAEKAVKEGRYSKYYIFIIAPQKYLDNNKEASKYKNQISYEQIRDVILDHIDIAMIDKALDESKHGYVPIEDRRVTDFWNSIYEFAEDRYPGVFRIWGKKGESRGANATWINISSGNGTTIVIKADRGYVDLEVAGYADKFQKFSKDNQQIIDNRKLYVRTATKSLAIRKYIDIIDFTASFNEQLDKIEDAFEKAKELQDLIVWLKF